MTLIKWRPTYNLSRWNPVSEIFSDLFQKHQEIDRIFDAFFSGGKFDDGTYGDFWTPIDIVEKDDAYIVEAEIPGMKKEDVKITIENNVLTIQGEKQQKKDEKDQNYRRSERVFGSFIRSFSLPSSVKVNEIDAKYQDGVLRITLPKAEEAKPKKIEVKVG